MKGYVGGALQHCNADIAALALHVVMSLLTSTAPCLCLCLAGKRPCWLCVLLCSTPTSTALALLVAVSVLTSTVPSAFIQVSLVKGYVGRALQHCNADIAADRGVIQQLQSDTAALRAEAGKLRSTAHVFQNSRCAATGTALELPVVHFMCGHSFNLRSLGE